MALEMSAVDHRDAHAEPETLTPKDRKICAELAQSCAGIDPIGNRPIEVNVTSPAGLREIEAFSGGHPAAAVLDLIERSRR